MDVLVRLTDDEIRTISERALRAEMGDLGFEGVEVRHRDIYDDESSLHVSAKVAEDVSAPFDAIRFSRLHGILHEALLAHGEERFPYFRLQRAGDAPPDTDPVTGEP